MWTLNTKWQSDVLKIQKTLSPRPHLVAWQDYPPLMGRTPQQMSQTRVPTISSSPVLLFLLLAQLEPWPSARRWIEWWGERVLIGCNGRRGRRGAAAEVQWPLFGFIPRRGQIATHWTEIMLLLGVTRLCFGSHSDHVDLKCRSCLYPYYQNTFTTVCGWGEA